MNRLLAQFHTTPCRLPYLLVFMSLLKGVQLEAKQEPNWQGKKISTFFLTSFNVYPSNDAEQLSKRS